MLYKHSVLSKYFSSILIIVLSLSALSSCAYNPYHFEEYKIKQIKLNGKLLPIDEFQPSIKIDRVEISISVLTEKWEEWDVKKLAGPYRILLKYLQFFDMPDLNYREVSIKHLQIKQKNEKEYSIAETLPYAIPFNVTPTVNGTPKQNDASAFLIEKYDFNYTKDVAIYIEFDLISENKVLSNIIEILFEPKLREGLFRPID